MQTQSEGFFRSFLIYYWPINCLSKKTLCASICITRYLALKLVYAGAKLWFPAIVFSSANTSASKFILIMLTKNTYIFTRANNPNVPVFATEDRAIQKLRKFNFGNFAHWE